MVMRFYTGFLALPPSLPFSCRMGFQRLLYSFPWIICHVFFNLALLRFLKIKGGSRNEGEFSFPLIGRAGRSCRS